MNEILSIWNTYRGAPNPEEFNKALIDTKMRDMKEPKSAIIDPTNILNYVGTRAKPSAISFAILRHMANIPAISAIILTRLNQVARFARRPSYEGDVGFRIVLKDKDAKMSEAQRKRAFEIENFFLKTGTVDNKKRKDNFNQFLRKVVRDSLALDAMVWENVPNYKAGLSEIWAVDAGTIEIVAQSPIGEGGDLPVYEPMTKAGMKVRGDIAYVQRVNGIITAEYTEDELAYGIRNPRTDLDYALFGMSELETLIEIVTGIVNSIRYNTGYFNHSNLPQGVMEIVGKYKDKHLEAFKRQWTLLTSGAVGKWKVPVLAIEEGQGFKFTPFKTSNRDMEFNEFLEFLFNIACAVYQIDPNEVGFKSWTSTQSGLSQSDNTEVKMEQSKDKGFVPLMNFLSDTFNSEIIDRIDDEFAFEWVGVSEQDELQKWELIEKKLATGVYVVADIRKQEDLEEIDEDWTKAPANPSLIQVYMAKVNAELQEQQMSKQQEQGANDAEGQSQASEVDHKRNMEVQDNQHEKQKEVLDIQHKHVMEQKKSDQEHQIKIEKMKAETAKKQQAGKPAASIKKALDTDPLEVGISWKDY